eukprot:7089295-Lingulodinium_polyedra.AAC.1
MCSTQWRGRSRNTSPHKCVATPHRSHHARASFWRARGVNGLASPRICAATHYANERAIV